MTWEKLLENEFEKDYFLNIKKHLENERCKYNIYPEKNSVFNAYKLTPFNKVKVVILGQDPYYNKGQSHGLSFSVNKGKIPPSIKNIFKELKNDLKITRTNYNLTDWAKEGVFLLNTCLTVREKQPLSHEKIGWQYFTLETIRLINKHKNNIIFILWGNNAIKYEKYIDKTRHLIIKTSHPSPLSANKSFLGSKPFSKTNNYLIKNNITPINW